MKTLLLSAFLASTLLTNIVQADNALSSLIYEESSNLFSEVNYHKGSKDNIRSYGDNYNKNSVWSSEFEEYINPADFNQNDWVNIHNINQYMDDNPTAAGKQQDDEVFTYNDTAGEYHLQ
jgi:phage head maturation protease